jgi:hypothetical protein
VLIRNHPELRDWSPDHGLAFPPPVVKVVYKPPSKIKFFLAYISGTCVIVKEFKDTAFALGLYRSRERLIGMPLALIGEINVKYRPLKALPGPLFVEP